MTNAANATFAQIAADISAMFPTWSNDQVRSYANLRAEYVAACERCEALGVAA